MIAKRIINAIVPGPKQLPSAPYDLMGGSCLSVGKKILDFMEAETESIIELHEENGIVGSCALWYSYGLVCQTRGNLKVLA